MRSIEWCHFRWSWVTLTLISTITQTQNSSITDLLLHCGKTPLPHIFDLLQFTNAVRVQERQLLARRTRAKLFRRLTYSSNDSENSYNSKRRLERDNDDDHHHHNNNKFKMSRPCYWSLVSCFRRRRRVNSNWSVDVCSVKPPTVG